MRLRNINNRKSSRLSTTNSDVTGGSSEESLTLHKPPAFGNAILQVPSKAKPTSGLSPVSENCISNKENICSPPFTESSSDDLFRPCSQQKAFFALENSFTRENAFSRFDDPYAHFSFPVTPKATPKFVLLPLKTPNSAIKERYITNEQKTALKKAALEGQRDFIRTLEKVGIDPRAHFSSLSVKKKCVKQVNFDCSTPKRDSSLDLCDTPSGKSMLETPMSGIKQLTAELSRPPEDSPSNLDFPFISNLADSMLSEEDSNFDTSLDDGLPEDVRATLLSGIVCFVDCRTGKEDRTESVKSELEKLGARVEKNFTKKVTHVVFKEGKLSTYIRAKKQNIPIVGILWIEACKRARGIADPSMHRPKKMEKYDRLLPFQMLPKRRFDILNPNSKVRKRILELCKDSPQLSPEKKGRSRKAVTEVKRKRLRDDSASNVDRLCTKRLFNGSKNPPSNCDTQNPQEIITIDSSSTDNSSILKEEVQLRRKSAPGKLLSKKNAKKQDIKDYFKKLEKEVKNENDISSLQDEFEKLDTHTKDDNDFNPRLLLTGFSQLNTQERKKIRLFDPNESPRLSQRSGMDSDPSVRVEDPYAGSSGEPGCPGTPKRRVRTKAMLGGKRPLKEGIARKLQNAQKSKSEAMDTDGTPSSLWFVEKPDSQCSTKSQEPPSISFTSIPKSELPKYNEIVKKLGKFTVDEKVSRHTTHLVSNGTRRTINLIKGIARGCWLIDIKWVLESEKCGKWLPPDNFSLFHAFPAAAESCKVRRSLKTSRVMDIFKEVGKVYVSRKLRGSPHYTDLEELLRLCGATIVGSSSKADIIVRKFRESSTARSVDRPPTSSTATSVSAKWVLDSVTQATLLPVKDFTEEAMEAQGSQSNC